MKIILSKVPLSARMNQSCDLIAHTPVKSIFLQLDILFFFHLSSFT